MQFSRFYTLHQRSLSEITKWQNEAVRDLVRHTYHNVPLWHELLVRLDIDPECFSGLDDLHRLPITDKSFYFGNAFDDYLDSSRSIRTPLTTTSGSTGKPLQLFPSDMILNPYYCFFSRFRFLVWKNNRIQPISSIRSVFIRGTQIYYGENVLFIKGSDFLNQIDDSIERIRAFHPDVIDTNPSFFLRMAQALARNQRGPLNIPYALSVSEILLPEVRNFVETTIGCNIYNRYASEEMHGIATECDMHDGMHIHPESVFVEIVDTNGHAVADGNEGRVIATNLINYNMPFIRYDTGDRGIMRFEPCACGMCTPRLWIEGRRGASLQFDGRPIDRMEFEIAIRHLTNHILQFQIVKTGPSDLLIRIIPSQRFTGETSDYIRKKMRDVVGPHVDIEIELVESIAQMPSGKSQTIVDESKVV